MGAHGRPPRLVGGSSPALLLPLRRNADTSTLSHEVKSSRRSLRCTRVLHRHRQGGAAAVVGLAYLFVFGAAAALIPFISIYYRSVGFGAGTIGWLLGVPLVVGVVAAPLWTALADARHRHRTVLAVTVSGAAGMAALIATTDRLALLPP